MLKLLDISTEDPVIDTYSEKFGGQNQLENSDTEKNKINRNSVSTKEVFYKGGLLEKVISMDRKKSPYMKFSKFCDHNWVLGFIIMKNFCRCNDTHVVNLGNGKGGFIAGIQYFLRNNCNIDWLGFDKKNNCNHKSYRNLSKYLASKNVDISQHAFCMDVENYYNFKDIVSMVGGKFKNVDILYNNISPTDKVITIFILLSIHILNDGIALTKIPDPENWDRGIINLYSRIFTKTHIFRLPICKNGEVFFQYYMIGFGKKSINYDILKRKLAFNYNNGQKVVIDSQIKNTKDIYLGDGDPLSDLYKIINVISGSDFTPT